LVYLKIVITALTAAVINHSAVHLACRPSAPLNEAVLGELIAAPVADIGASVSMELAPFVSDTDEVTCGAAVDGSTTAPPGLWTTVYVLPANVRITVFSGSDVALPGSSADAGVAGSWMVSLRPGVLLAAPSPVGAACWPCKVVLPPGSARVGEAFPADELPAPPRIDPISSAGSSFVEASTADIAVVVESGTPLVVGDCA